MSITDELREWTRNYTVNCSDTRIALVAIANRIDAEHAKAIRELNNLADASVLLPVDADGEYIHIGDVMENLREDLEPSLHHRFTVYGIHYRAYGKECALTEDGYPSKLYRASETRHYHAPTVEDVLREFADEVYADADNEIRDRDFLCAKYAKRLALAGDAE